MNRKVLMSAILAGSLVIPPFSSMGMTASAADPAIISGDVNADGSFDVSDVVLFQKWLLSVSGVVLADWKAADFCADNELDVFDLCIMKQQLLNAAVSEPKDDVQTNYAIEFTGTTVKVSDENDNAVTAQDAVLVKDQVVTIIMPGEYTITGSSENGQLIVDVDKTAYPDGKVTLNLEGLTLSNPSTAPLYVASIDDECVISVKKGTVNTLSDGISHTDTYTDSDGEVHTIESTIFSRDDLKIKGKGTLRVNGNTADGIVCKNDLKLQNGTIEVTAVDDGIRGKDSVRIGDKDDRSNDSTLIITVTTQNGDGIQSTETDNESKGAVDIYGGTINIDAHSDGIFASRSVNVYGGDINIKTYEGGSYAAASGSQGSFEPPTGETPEMPGEMPTEPSTGEDTGSETRPTPPGGFGGQGGQTRPGFPGGQGGTGGMGGMESGHDLGLDFSCKGIKAGDTSIDGDITISGGAITLDSTDDAIHCGGSMTINGGDITVSTADDALHCDKYLNVNDGTINVEKCYEGLEAMQIRMKDGDVTVYAEDDPFNAGEKGVKAQVDVANDNCIIQIDGGIIHAYVTNVREGDGIDSNGSIIINGGEVYVEGSVNGPDSALDSDGEMLVNGGIVVAVGGLGRGELPENTSKQNSLYWGDSSTAYPAGSVVALLDAEGNELLSYTSVQTLKCAVISIPAIQTGEQYSITVNGKSVAEFTVRSALTTQGDIGSAGGGQPGRQG